MRSINGREIIQPNNSTNHSLFLEYFQGRAKYSLIGEYAIKSHSDYIQREKLRNQKALEGGWVSKAYFLHGEATSSSRAILIVLVGGFSFRS